MLLKFLNEENAIVIYSNTLEFRIHTAARALSSRTLRQVGQPISNTPLTTTKRVY